LPGAGSYEQATSSDGRDRRSARPRQLEQILAAAARTRSGSTRTGPGGPRPGGGAQEQEQGLPRGDLRRRQGRGDAPGACAARAKGPMAECDFGKRAGPGEKKGASGWPRTLDASSMSPRGSRGPRKQVMRPIPAHAQDGPRGGEPLVRLRHHRRPRRPSPSARSSTQADRATPGIARRIALVDEGYSPASADPASSRRGITLPSWSTSSTSAGIL